MAVGAPLGVTLNHYFGISGFATVVVLVAAIGLLFARTRQDVKVTAGARAPFHAVVRKIWPYGLGLAFGTVGFGVIATFITLYFAAHSWQGAAFTLSLFSVGFICVRLVLGNTITRFGGVPVSPRLLHHRKSRPAAYLAGAISMDGRRRRLSHRFGFLAGLSGFRS